MSFLKKHSSEIDILFQITKVYIKEKFDIDIESLKKLKEKSRKRPLVHARKMMMVVLSEVYNSQKYTQEEIAKTVGLDRTSLIHHFKMHLNDYSIVKGYKEEYDNLRDTFLEKIKS